MNGKLKQGKDFIEIGGNLSDMGFNDNTPIPTSWIIENVLKMKKRYLETCCMILSIFPEIWNCFKKQMTFRRKCVSMCIHIFREATEAESGEDLKSEDQLRQWGPLSPSMLCHWAPSLLRLCNFQVHISISSKRNHVASSWGRVNQAQRPVVEMITSVPEPVGG